MQLQLQDSSPKVTNIGYAFFQKGKNDVSLPF